MKQAIFCNQMASCAGGGMVALTIRPVQRVAFAGADWRRREEIFATKGCRRGEGQNALSPGGRKSARKLCAGF